MYFIFYPIYYFLRDSSNIWELWCIAKTFRLLLKGTVSVFASDPPCKDGTVSVHNVTLERYRLFFWLEKCLILIISPLLHISHKCVQVTFPEKLQMKLNSLKKQKHKYLIHIWSDKAFKGTVVNRALLSLLWRVTWNYALKFLQEINPFWYLHLW